MDDRKMMWTRIATDLKPSWLDTQESVIVGLDAVEPHLDAILKGQVKSRVLVDPRI
jgi:hypothetical protein